MIIQLQLCSWLKLKTRILKAIVSFWISFSKPKSLYSKIKTIDLDSGYQPNLKLGPGSSPSCCGDCQP